VSDELTVSGDAPTTYDFRYNANGAIESMLVAGSTGTPSETNVWDRRFTWTLMNQMTSASDGSEIRTFAYADTGALMIQDGNLLTRDGDVVAQRGGGPETIFLNAWVTIRAQKIYKHINDGLDKIVTKMDSDGSREDTQMFLHTDVVGSTNIVTDNQGRGFQRHEYFPSGEIWIIDNKEQIRTPFQFGDGYYEEEFDLILFGARWYDTERELFLSPDPLLAAKPRALIDQPALGAAYTYAGANAVGNVDPDGMAFFTAQQSAAVTARAQAAFDLDQFVLEISGEGDKAQVNQAVRTKQLEGQARAEAVLEPASLIEIDLNEGTVSIGPPYGPRKEWSTKGGNDGSPAAPSDDSRADNSPSSADDSLDASNGAGGPDAGPDGALPGSARVSVPDAATGNDADSGSESGDDTRSAQQLPSPSPSDHGAAGGADNNRSDH
jgi:RHS repeat-associated protein